MNKSFILGERKVTAVVVTFNRDNLLNRCLEQIYSQSYKLNNVIVVDNARSHSTLEIVKEFNFTYVEGSPEYGGAGGYALGMKTALRMEANYVWLLDDDGYPDLNCLEIQLEASAKNSLSVSTPLCVDELDHSKTSNPYILDFKKVTSSDRVSSKQIRWGGIQLFNGALLDISTIEKIGYPNQELFIRGDELDYYYRIIRSNIPNALITTARYFHPSSASEYPNSRTSLLGVVIPSDEKKKYYQFRNQGYLVRRHRLIIKAMIDWLRYSIYFLIYPGRDFKGFNTWSKLWFQGFALKLEPYRPSKNPGSNA